MFQAYKKIFSRLGLRFRAVEADTGAIGGSQSHEFQVLAESGEDAIVSCNQCEYAANVQKAESRARHPAGRELGETSPELQKVSTPGKKSVAEVSEYLKLPAEKFIKTLVYKTDKNELVAALVRGDHEINELKLQAVLGCREIALANEAEVEAATQVSPGFLGPIGLELRSVGDLSIQGMRGAVTGANEPNAHYIEVDQERDFSPGAFADIRLAVTGDLCPRCDEGFLESYRGIEVGQIFYLGRKYSEVLGATYLDDEGRERPIEMGCYGIGISRLVAAAIEQNNDSNGVIWPFFIAPFHVLLLPINYRDKAIQAATDRIYQQLQKRGVEVLLDDRDERPGVKFKDADLIGIPLRLTIGAKGLEKSCVELRWRRDGKTEEIPLGDAAQAVHGIVTQALQT
jgi:prolyl-tRNA synthetase